MSTTETDFILTEKGFEEVYGRLYAYVHAYINSLDWYIKLGPQSTIKGKQIDDYVMDAIEYYLTNPDGYKESEGTLLNYLKLNVLRNIIRPDARSAENTNNRDVNRLQLQREESDQPYVDSIYPLIENTIGDEIDLSIVLKEMEEEVMLRVKEKDDTDLENVFLGSCVSLMSRKEIMDEFEMSSTEYVNAYRRLGTIRSKIQRKYNMERQKS